MRANEFVLETLEIPNFLKMWFNFETGEELKGFQNHLRYARRNATLFGFPEGSLDEYEGHESNRELTWKLAENGWARVSISYNEIDVDTTSMKDVHKVLMMLSKKIQLPDALFYDTKDGTGHLENSQWGREFDLFLKQGRLPGKSRKIDEEFLTAFNEPGGEYVELFVNPTEKELQSINNDEGMIRGFLTKDKMIVWDAYKSIHYQVAKQIGLSNNDALGIYLYYDPSDYDLHIQVTDFNRDGPWHHNPETADWIREHPAIWVDPNYVQITYYDEDVVGDWEELEKEEVTNA